MVAEVTKPDFSYVWASGGAIVMPSNVKTQTGWTAEVPPFQWENALQNRQDNAIVHLFQKGISEWDAGSNYYFTTNGTRSYVQGSNGIIYVAVQDNLGQNPTTDLSNTYWKVAFASSDAGYLTQTTADGRYTQRVNNLSDLTNPVIARTNLSVYSTTQTDSAISLAPSIQGVYRNLKISATGLSALVSLTVDSITVGIPGGSTKTLDNISLPSISLATSGVNGLDIGTSAASTWYSVWVIWNGTTTAGLLSLSATAPTMPAGYTHKARVGWIRTDATADKYPFSFFQYGRRVNYRLGGGNMTTFPALTVGAVGSYGVSFSTASISAFCPPTASSIRLSYGATASSNIVIVIAPNPTYTPILGNVKSPPLCSTNQGSTQSFSGEMPLESSNVYISAQGSTYSSVIGWEDNL